MSFDINTNNNIFYSLIPMSRLNCLCQSCQNDIENIEGRRQKRRCNLVLLLVVVITLFYCGAVYLEVSWWWQSNQGVRVNIATPRNINALSNTTIIYNILYIHVSLELWTWAQFSLIRWELVSI